MNTFENNLIVFLKNLNNLEYQKNKFLNDYLDRFERNNISRN